MIYAVIRSGGKQYRVAKGDTVVVDSIPGEKETTVSFDEILLVGNGERVTVGMPFVANAKVTGKVVEQRKGDKIRVAKYKQKVRYRRIYGFRPLQTVLSIEEILVF